MKFYADNAAGYLGLKAGEIDVLLWQLSSAQYSDAITDPNVILMPVLELGKRQFDLNNNYTLTGWQPSGIPQYIDPIYGKVRNPLNLREFRQAVAYMVDKDYIVNAIVAGFGVRIDVPVPAPSASWWNTSVTGVNYPYPYNLTQANAELDAAGFLDHNGDGKRNYPLDWDMGTSGLSPATTNVHPLVFSPRNDDPLRFAAATHLRNNLVSCGLQVDWRPTSIWWPPLYTTGEFHIYTGGWSLGRYSTFLYSGYHNLFWYSGGPNYLTGLKKDNTPNYPTLNTQLDNFYYAPTIADAEYWAKLAQGTIVTECISIELWSAKSFYGYRNLLGAVNMDATGPNNIYTYMNAYRADDPTQDIRFGLQQPPERVNPIYSKWLWDSQVLSGFMDEPFYANPYDITIDNPWRAQDWLTSTWIDDTTEKTQVTWWYRPNINWAQPATGNVLKSFTAEDVEFSIWYYYQTPDAWVYSSYKDVHSVKHLADNKVTVKFNSRSLWFTWSSLARQIPFAKGWLTPPLTTLETRLAITADANGYLPLPRQAIGAPVKIVSCTDPTAQIVLGYIKVTPLATVDVVYYARGNAAGYWAGGLDWHQVAIGTGPYYLYDFVAGIGGFAQFKANRNYFMPTPPLGEIDWQYRWTGTPPANPGDPPRSGCWKVDIYDIVMLAAAYGSSARAVPTSNWKPGADLTVSGDGKPGEIDIYDIVTACASYGQEWP
jgi:hypothetical protein